MVSSNFSDSMILSKCKSDCILTDTKILNNWLRGQMYFDGDNID